MVARRARLSPLRLWFIALYALSAALVGFGHHAARAGTSPDLAAYTLPDGTVPVLCLTAADSSDPAQPGRLMLCDTCVLMAGASLPPPLPVVEALRPDAGARLVPVSDTQPLARRVVAASARGPPCRDSDTL